MRKLFSILIFGNFWIGIVAIMMCFFTKKAFGISLPDAFLPFVFFSTLTSYSFHAYLSSFYLGEKQGIRANWIIKNRSFLLLQSLICGLISAFFYFELQLFSLYILPIILATFLYSAPQIPTAPFIFLRKIAIAKTLYLSVSWGYVTIALPFLIGNISFFELKSLSFMLNRFLLIYLVAILFDKKDKEMDTFLSVKNFITYMNTHQIWQLITFCCLLFFISTFLFYQETQDFPLFFALILPMIFLLISLPILEKTDNDYLFYGYLDGILMLSGLCIF